MPAVVVSSREQSSLQRSIPAWDVIRDAFAKYSPHTNRALGAWVGPAPRVTRASPLGVFQTTAAWLYAWDDTPRTPQIWADLHERIRSAVADGLAEQSSDWGPVILTPYSPSLHGSVQWWQSGQAAIARTRDMTPEGVGRLATPDNPFGPTTAQTHLPGTPEVLDSLGTAGKWALGGAVALGGLYVLATLVPRRR